MLCKTQYVGKLKSHSGTQARIIRQGYGKQRLLSSIYLGLLKYQTVTPAIRFWKMLN